MTRSGRFELRGFPAMIERESKERGFETKTDVSGLRTMPGCIRYSILKILQKSIELADLAAFIHFLNYPARAHVYA